MKKFWVVLFGMLAFGVITYGQNGENREKYVIKIGNDNQSIYWQVLDYLEKSHYVSVYARCPDLKLIGVVVLNHEFKDYYEFLKYLRFEFDDLRIYRDDDSSFTPECLKNNNK